MLALWIFLAVGSLPTGRAISLPVPTSSEHRLPLTPPGRSAGERARPRLRQLSGLPSCVINCLSSAAAAAGCSSYTDVGCVCPSYAYLSLTASGRY
ncbi:hypothetical protein CALCODRAFT_500375 [Calocera cornea HHB12733]|uniref:CFEM domain-containing protein n=1 Tax=Calocera cornea HHB12733 TaxID=1353952 RepID=A0A165E3V4_9BASI|nr:hypothetical protein CALCODRAFT_500375 [Calocera cornea HHB12733]